MNTTSTFIKRRRKNVIDNDYGTRYPIHMTKVQID